MGTALCTNASNEGSTPCPYHADHVISWLADLPTGLKDLVGPPVSFDVARDYDMLADHTQGCDAAKQPCFNEFRYLLTQLRSEDDEVFYDATV
jgi:hypothetical protein